MKKSDKIEKMDEFDEVPKQLDYSSLPKEIEEAVKENPYEVEKEVKLSWDGKQFLIRIPLEISEEIGITKENKCEFKIKFKLIKARPNTDEVTKVSMELIK